MGRKFEDSSGADLPVGSHEPCQLLSITRHEPSEANLEKWPDMKPSLCFRFMLHKPDDPELHGATAVRFVSDTVSKLGALYGFVTDLCDGKEPDEFDETDYTGQWYRATVRKRPQTEKLFVSTASPIDAPEVEDGWSESEAIEKARKKAKKRLKKEKKARKTKAEQVEQELASVAASDEDENDEIPF